MWSYISIQYFYRQVKPVLSGKGIFMRIRILENAKTIISNPDGRHNYFGWPSVARLQDGRIAVACSGFRCAHVCPFGKAVIAVSFDEGEIYTGPWPVIDTPLDDRDAGIVPFGDNGVIFTSFNNTRSAQRSWNPVRDDQDPQTRRRNAYFNAYLDTVTDGEEEKYLGSTFRMSFDGGKTFGELHRSPVTSPHGPTALSDGTLLWVGRTFSKDDSFGDADRLEAWRVSRDGATELVGSVPPVYKNGLKIDSCEPHAIELPDGTLLCHFRGERHGHFTLFQTVSRDGGRTWSAPEQLLGDQGGAPAHLYMHSTGLLISVYGYRTAPRYGIRAMLSRDCGKSWEKDLILWETPASGDLGYPATVERKDGSLLTVFYAKDEQSGPAVIKQIRWSLQ